MYKLKAPLREVLPAIAGFDTVSLESHYSDVLLEVVILVREQKVMLGTIDGAIQQVNIPGEVAETRRKALEYIDAYKLIAATNCGMAPFPRDIALAKLGTLSAGAEVLREELTGSCA